MPIPLIIAALAAAGSAGAGVYGAHLQDKQNAAALAYQKQRDALGDKRQEEQDKIARKQELLAMLGRFRQQGQEYTGMWHPSMAQQGRIQARE